MDGKTSTNLVGIIKDIMIKLDKLSFLVNFMVIAIEEDPKIPLILGRPFMKMKVC